MCESECVCDVQTGRQCEEAELSPSQLAFSASYLIMAHSNANELKDQPCGCKVCVCVCESVCVCLGVCVCLCVCECLCVCVSEHVSMCTRALVHCGCLVYRSSLFQRVSISAYPCVSLRVLMCSLRLHMYTRSTSNHARHYKRISDTF